MIFINRDAAGLSLTEALKDYKDQSCVVFALPRGGVPIGAIVAQFLNAPFDLLIPRKIGYPGHEEYAIGAVCEKGEPVLNQAEVSRLDASEIDAKINAQRNEAKRRRELYLQDRKPVEVNDKTTIIVDDGIATGLTMQAAIQDLKQRKPARIVVAVPVAHIDSVHKLASLVDDVIVIDRPENFLGAVGAHYGDFWQFSDGEVVNIMSQVNDVR
ncbi:MAG: phosphoribosyl transferase [Nitrosomonas sp.]|nr:phosphoribosyl transferase [Nitrosomonas sp.]